MHGRIKKLSGDLVIDLSHNRFEGPLPSISSNTLPLYLSNNMFSGSISQFLCNRPSDKMNLEILNLQNNQLSGVISNCWSTMWKNLVILKVSDNKFNSTIPYSLGSLVLLWLLHLRNNNLSGELLVMKGQEMEYIENLGYVSSIDLSGEIPHGMGKMGAL
ncbi:hypothetical protein FEM48_Zijuj03G0156800 [Ziziphus jujuba var. spinosa]|uniref:Uncharacterized protein n=1 Tax=Ziziphus jujuba var. spinosa TaxID=714518 RepID=A0A978VR62_ZIZJJ|nr:hypothetical protein FEM48_Zijuj03G0156800 [Ziziphus jujuba var. spinosa]